MDPSVVNVGIIGCGVVSGFHAEGYRGAPGARLRWACDRVPARAERLARDFGIPRRTTRYLEALDDPGLDAVSICTDHASHAEIAAAAIERGKHVLCEKALAESAGSLERILSAHAARPGVVFSGVFQHRFDPVFLELRRLAGEGVFGPWQTLNLNMLCRRPPEYYRADDWRGTWSGEGGSLLINQAIHFLDLLLWLGGPVRAVSCAYANRTHGDSIETEDTAAAALRFESGALGSVCATSSAPVGFEPSFSLAGTRGAVDLREGRVTRLDLPGEDGAARLRAAFERREAESRGPAAKPYYGAGHAAQTADFIAAIREGRPPRVTGIEAAEAVRLVLAMYEAHRRGGWIEPAGRNGDRGGGG